MKFRGTVICIMAVAALVVAAVIIPQTSVYKWQRFLRLKDKTAAAQTGDYEIDANGIPEHYQLEHGRLTVTAQGKQLWQTPRDWWIDSFAVADANNDGKTELALSVWKVGSFGRLKPFWHKGADNQIANHLFVYALDHGAFRPLWQSSALVRPNCLLRFAGPLGEVKLYAGEGNYTPDFSCHAVTSSIWQWNGWGFALEQSQAMP